MGRRTYVIPKENAHHIYGTVIGVHYHAGRERWLGLVVTDQGDMYSIDMMTHEPEN